MKRLLLLFLLLPAALLAQRRQLTVAQDGSGDYRTVQAAFDAVPDGNADWLTMRVKPGTCKEKLTLAAAKTRVRRPGEDAARTIFTCNDYHQRPDAAGQETALPVRPASTCTPAALRPKIPSLPARPGR